MDHWKTPVQRVRTMPGGVDQYGDPLPGVEVTSDLPPALFSPGGASAGFGTSEPVSAGATPVISSPALFWRGEWPDVLASDRLVVHGVKWRVEGRPAIWPRGLAVSLKGVEDGGQVHAE